MAWPRLQLFEFNDSAWAPRALRDTIIDALGTSLEWGRVMDGVVPAFTDFVARSGADELLELASGSGHAGELLLSALARGGVAPPRLVLTDLFPQLPRWRTLRDAHPAAIDFVPEPVDATDVPAGLATGRARVILNALHHLPEGLAQKALLDATRHDSRGVFVVEGLTRNPLRFAAFAPWGLAALMTSPLRGGSQALSRAALTWLTPAAVAASVWDGTVSSLRVYDEATVRRLVAPAGDGWTWTFGTFSYAFGGRGTWFSGLPRRP